MNISNMIEEIIETGSRGKELVKDAFIIGLAWGRQILKDNNDLQLAIKQLSSINDNIDNSTVSPFCKEDKFNEFLNNNNFQLFNIPRLLNQQPYQVTPPQKKLQENQQPLNNLQNQSPFKGNVSPQKGKELQSLKTCQLCNFYTDPSKTIQIAKLSQCQHQFHFLCLYIHIQEYGEYCPICQQDLEKNYPQYIFESIPQQYKSCCPSLKCLNYFIYFGQDVFNCNGCKEKWCLKCKKQYHHNSECTFEIDHYRMSLGQKFKCCLNCKKVLFLNELPINLNQAFPKHC